MSATYTSLKTEGLVRVVGDERISGPRTGNNSGKTVYLRAITPKGWHVLRRARNAVHQPRG